MDHLRGIVAIARRNPRGHDAIDAGEVVRRELEVERSKGLGQTVAAARADQRHDIPAARQDPGDAAYRSPSVCIADSLRRCDKRAELREVVRPE